MSKLTRVITDGEQLQNKIRRGVEAVYKVARACYGPTSGNASIELNYGAPQISHDGVTNLRKVYLDDPDENAAARILVQASERSNKIVGDGTTNSVILARNLYEDAVKLVGSGFNRMEVSRMIKSVAADVIAEVDKVKIETTPELARHVAKISAGDEGIGDMVADVIDEVGLEGNIIVEEFDGSGSFDETVDGFYFRKGFSHQYLVNNLTALESRISDADIIITDKKLESERDMLEIINKCISAGGKGAEVLIVGDVTGDALAVLALNKVKGNIFPTLVDVPVFGAMRTLFLEDLAIYTGGKVLPTGAKASSFSVDMLGNAKQVVVNSYSTTVIGGKGVEEDINYRIDDLRTQLKKAESLVDQEEIKKRLSTLQGKISIIHVGAPTEADRGEVQLRVEDAIAAVQSALRDGIVPGGGVCLAKLAPETFTDAFRASFKALVENAGYNAEQAIFKVLERPELWVGYDLKDDSFNYEPKDLLKLGVIDPAEVVKETVKNASSVAATLITTTISLTFKDRESVA